MKADFILFGYGDYVVKKQHAACFLNLCHQYGILYTPLAGETHSARHTKKVHGSSTGERSRRKRKTTPRRRIPLPGADHGAEGECGGASTSQETAVSKEQADLVEKIIDEDLRIRCRLSYTTRLCLLCASRGINIRLERKGGLPLWFYRYRRRMGLLIGAVLAFVLFYMAGNVIWDVRVDGEESIDVTAFVDELDECGLRVGSWIPKMDTDAIERRILSRSDKVAWISVNLKGTVAYVQIRELMRPPKTENESFGQPSGQPVNLVARCDGIIESVRLVSGEVVVKPGELVRAGDLLISGVRDSGNFGYRIRTANGQVMAVTEHTMVVQIPLKQQEKSYLPQKSEQKTLFFFGKSIKVTKNSGNFGEECDTIKKMEVFSLGSGVPLPIFVETVIARPFEWREICLSEQQAERMAEDELERQLNEALADQGILLSKAVSRSVSEEYYTINCRYRCVENIAEKKPFSVQTPEAGAGE